MRHLLRALPFVLLAVACGDGHDGSGHDDHGQGEHAGEHVHAAPRGGTLIVLAEETAHLEVLLDRGSGRLSVYVLGPHAETPVRVAQTSLDLTLTVGAAEVAVSLPAVTSELTGETVGDTSEFAADVEALRGIDAFRGTITEVSARGATYTAVEFSYP